MDNISALIGLSGAVQVGGMLVAVKVMDARQCYGRTDCLVRPVAGEGEQWVRLDSLIIDK